MAMMDISVSPLGTGSTSLGAYVAAAVDVIRASGLAYRLNSGTTTVEGDLGALLALVPKIHDAIFAMGVGRVSTLVKIDDRRDRAATMASKVASIEQRLA
ncbi:MAG: MTH1187 family thiamine-binding protein [Armatimonadetes bacterium]|nr:MTH1187 family thiamine-binding protein [Armatimonadota bacterium]